MSPTLLSVVILAFLAAAVLLGRVLRRHLPGDHLGAESRDSVKLAMGLVATMTALLLGLLVSSAKGTYDVQRAEVIQMAATIAFVDRAFVLYGPEASSARTQFRLSVEDAVHRMWPAKASQPADLSPNVASGDALYSTIHRLNPQDELQRSMKAQILTQATELGRLRGLLLAQSVPSVATPLLAAVVCWLLVIFLFFSLLAPPNATTTLAIFASILSVAGAIFLVLELDRPLGGWIEIPGQPLHAALKHLAAH